MTTDSQDYQDFLEGGKGEALVEAPTPILKDLVGSRRALCLHYGLASVLGYLASLMICAQCSVGFTALSWKTAAMLHDIPDPWCPLVCGMVFGIFPFLCSSLWISRFQHRYLLFRMTWVPIVVPLLANLVMTLFGPIHDLSWQFLWFAAAAGTPYLAEMAFRFGLRQRPFREGESGVLP